MCNDCDGGVVRLEVYYGLRLVDEILMHCEILWGLLLDFFFLSRDAHVYFMKCNKVL